MSEIENLKKIIKTQQDELDRLKFQNTKYKSIFNKLDFNLFVINSSLKIIELNLHSLSELDYSADLLVNSSITDLFAENEQKRLSQKIKSSSSYFDPFESKIINSLNWIDSNFLKLVCFFFF